MHNLYSFHQHMAQLQLRHPCFNFTAMKCYLIHENFQCTLPELPVVEDFPLPIQLNLPAPL